MSFLRGSTNYVWCTTSVLGKGATGAVFQGINRNNGEPVAVKTFNQLSHMRPHDVQVREFEVLKKVKHENIVKLLAIEEEQEGRGKVIVMELCTGGSLFNILDDPENTYGLQEEEFLLVLEHLSAGMKHLRDNNLVHRDLKPGNIMKFISSDGLTIYKLTDFGAARELEEDQQFMSLYGTEEYLHPDMYERAVLRKPVGKTFGATVDLWSIGVTLYHVATGNLPFRPFGGRRNKETMYYITTKKASGVISGIQTSENGPIDWCRDLPKNCQLSAGLKKLVTPLLAGLLEVDSQRIWTFDKFFTEVTNALTRKPVHVYHINKAQSIRIYVHPDDVYSDFQALVHEQTEITAENQIILFKDTHLTSLVGEGKPSRTYPLTELASPMLLFSKENNNVVIIADSELPKFPSFPNNVSVENDATLAKTACSVGHVCKRRIERLSMCSKLTHDSVTMFNIVVGDELTRVISKCNHLKRLAKEAELMVDAVMRGQKTVHNLLGVKSTASFINWREKMDVLTKELVSGLSLAIQQLYTRYVAEQALVREWESTTRDCACPHRSRAPARARILVDRLRDSWQHLLRDRATRNLTFNDEQFHVLEKIKVAETGKMLKMSLEQEVAPCVTQLSDMLADWYKMAQTVYLQARILDKDVETFERRLDALVARVVDNDLSFHDELVNVSRVKGAGRIRGQELKSLFRTSIKDILSGQDEISTVISENTDLIRQFKGLAAEEKSESEK
ncbi:serine/threonine-protein kinase TBK1 isoform X1 [Nilaparvata lugens]|uniref:serine/threonine-protein kinase TBK1 isoform X2 n=1 Tax=Nilaparvata lugens TaxID=108931 RepID=UPI00193E15D8|nr:serine/threonine-protein kinase TBK1 isoform X2 [Nilaparvata lugens]XP_039278466.1 serine/threonine-protein kinase TBK1 isoform X1 [Nilaparvata lugens]